MAEEISREMSLSISNEVHRQKEYLKRKPTFTDNKSGSSCSGFAPDLSGQSGDNLLFDAAAPELYKGYFHLVVF
ncbi:MAG: hypothetical protein ACLTTP_05360 [Alistipes ihumii]